MTNHELERAAYMSGDTERAVLLAQIIELDALCGDDTRQSAITYIEEAQTAFPGEDCLESIIQEARMMARARVTKAEVMQLVEMMESLQNELARSSEYGLDELKQARRLLK
jgi:uncharacterized protein YqcC (DUF446 family)